MDGFELSEKILKLDIDVKICFMSSGEVNHEAIREIHPSLNIGCFIQKPVTVRVEWDNMREVLELVRIIEF
jgi:hypothetical protein